MNDALYSVIYAEIAVALTSTFQATITLFLQYARYSPLRIAMSSPSENTDCFVSALHYQVIQDSFLAEVENEERQEEIRRKVEMQDERDEEIKMMAKKTVTKVLGKLKGTQWDPLPGPEIEYSDLRKLLDKGVVRYARYGDYGKHVEGENEYVEERITLVSLSVVGA